MAKQRIPTAPPIGSVAVLEYDSTEHTHVTAAKSMTRGWHGVGAGMDGHLTWAQINERYRVIAIFYPRKKEDS
jgi:hypothetical protein